MDYYTQDINGIVKYVKSLITLHDFYVFMRIIGQYRWQTWSAVAMQQSWPSVIGASPDCIQCWFKYHSLACLCTFIHSLISLVVRSFFQSVLLPGN